MCGAHDRVCGARELIVVEGGVVDLVPQSHVGPSDSTKIPRAAKFRMGSWGGGVDITIRSARHHVPDVSRFHAGRDGGSVVTSSTSFPCTPMLSA